MRTVLILCLLIGPAPAWPQAPSGVARPKEVEDADRFQIAVHTFNRGGSSAEVLLKLDRHTGKTWHLDGPKDMVWRPIPEPSESEKPAVGVSNRYELVCHNPNQGREIYVRFDRQTGKTWNWSGNEQSWSTIDNADRGALHVHSNVSVDNLTEDVVRDLSNQFDMAHYARDPEAVLRLLASDFEMRTHQDCGEVMVRTRSDYDAFMRYYFENALDFQWDTTIDAIEIAADRQSAVMRSSGTERIVWPSGTTVSAADTVTEIRLDHRRPVVSRVSVRCKPPAEAPWSPGENPSPRVILDEARADAAAGRYPDALAKHVWFFENALRYAPAMYGVRLSYALSDWKALSDSYPPALEKLKAERDEAATKVRESKDSRHSFHDFTSINKVLAEDAKTRDLFLWLDTNSSATAALVYDLAQPSLVRAREYRVCGKYLDPDRSLERMIRLYNANLKYASDSEFRQKDLDFADKSLSNSVGTLIALLVVNGRTADAKRVADGAMKARDDSAFRERLQSALRGEVPPPWP